MALLNQRGTGGGQALVNCFVYGMACRTASISRKRRNDLAFHENTLGMTWWVEAKFTLPTEVCNDSLKRTMLLWKESRHEESPCGKPDTQVKPEHKDRPPLSVNDVLVKPSLQIEYPVVISQFGPICCLHGPTIWSHYQPAPCSTPYQDCSFLASPATSSLELMVAHSHNHLCDALTAKRLAPNERLAPDGGEQVAEAGQGEQHAGGNEAGVVDDGAQELDDAHDSIGRRSRVVGRDLADGVIELARRGADPEQEGDLNKEDNEGRHAVFWGPSGRLCAAVRVASRAVEEGVGAYRARTQNMMSSGCVVNMLAMPTAMQRTMDRIPSLYQTSPG